MGQKRNLKSQNQDNAEDGKGRTVWMVEHASREELKELLEKVPERTETVPDILLRHMGKTGMSTKELAGLAGLGRSTGFKIMNGKQRAERDVLLRLAFVLGFNYTETVQLLKSGTRAALTANSGRDVAIIYGLQNHLSLGDMDDVLEKYGFPPLVPPQKE